jgi:hypothetical protein
MFIGGVNGGIWRTTNGGATWTPLTDNQGSLSIASLALDPSDPTGKTLIAGVGITSNGVGIVSASREEAARARACSTRGTAATPGPRWAVVPISPARV